MKYLRSVAVPAKKIGRKHRVSAVVPRRSGECIAAECSGIVVIEAWVGAFQGSMLARTDHGSLPLSRGKSRPRCEKPR